MRISDWSSDVCSSDLGERMKYYLRRHAIGPQVMVEIDQARYERLVASRRTLVDALSFEQRYELLLGNFTAFEMFCAELSVRSNFEFDFRYETWAIVLADRSEEHTSELQSLMRLSY